MTSRVLKVGDRFVINRVVTPDYDSFAVIHYGKGWAFGCGREWYEREQPVAGASIVYGPDDHFHVVDTRPENG